MALKKPTFENEPAADNVDTAVAEAPWQETPAASTPAAATPSREAEAKATTTEVIAKATNTAVAVEGAAADAKKFQKEFDAMRGASNFDYGNYPIFKGNNGEISESGGDEATLGRWAQVRLLSWDEHFEISPGEQGASTKDFVAYSKGGVVIDSIIGEEMKVWVGKPVQDYANYLRTEEEFANTKVRRFIDTACALMATDNGDGPIGKVIQITLSESSISSFSRYQQELQDTARCVQMGLPGFKMPADPFTFFFIREVTSKGANRWTKLKISATLPSKL